MKNYTPHKLETASKANFSLELGMKESCSKDCKCETCTKKIK